MAVTQPGGAGTPIFVYDNAGAANGLYYTFAEIAAAFPADFVDNGTNAKSYRAKVSLQIGDAGVGTATTTLQDTDSTVIWDNTKTLVWRATQTTSWFCNFGTKVDIGNEASGKSGSTLIFGANTTVRGNLGWFGSSFKIVSGVINFTNTIGTSSDIQNCLMQSTVAGVSPFVLNPSLGVTAFNLFNVDISHATTSQVMSNFTPLTAERLTICASTPTTFIQTGLSAIQAKDMKMFGTPSTSDIRWAAGSANDWKFIRPGFSGSAPKFTGVTVGVPALAQATLEYWLFDVKVVDGAGVGIANIPVKLTDVTGELQVDTLTMANGEIDFGSGITDKAVKVMDHYIAPGGTVYTQRHRSPFLLEVNTGASALVGYQARRYYFNWPGYESITLTGGTFKDVNDIINLGEPSISATNWTEFVL